jgi:lipoprotein-anchoring transpeptidase ErfK/SrfK
MIIGRALRRAAVAAGAVVAAGCFQVAPASAQLFWDWGGGSMVDGSGREVVRFSQQFPKGQIIVSFGDRRLYFITKPGEAISYPIAIPREESRWQGNTTVTSKRENPSWTPTPTMIAENPRLPRWVPGGHPMNPLGVRALYLGSSTYRIHGTDAPWTIGSAVSKGCIRMYNQDVLDLYPRTSVGAKVIVTWQKYGAVASNSGGSFFGSSDDDEAPPATRSAVKKVSKVQKQ